MQTFDMVAVGEILIDLVDKTEPGGSIVLNGNAGGAPANVLCAAAKLGCSTSFIGRVGRDFFGAFLKERIAAAGVDISRMAEGSEPTTLAMVHLDATGNRSFSFYRTQTADVMLAEGDVDMAAVAAARLFHFGSVSMTAEPARTATLAAAAAAKAAGGKVSFDPNYRPLLWASPAEAVDMMKKGVQLADYVKVSDEEATLLTGEADPEAAAAALMATYGMELACVTIGPRGCVGVSRHARVASPAFDVKTVDTTGAGDSFWGAVLAMLLRRGANAPLDEAALAEILRFGNAAGSLTTTRYGAIPALPTEAEILDCMAHVPVL